MSIRGLNLANLLEGQKLEERPTVLMRFSGASPESVDSVLEKVREIVKENKGEIRIAKDQRENDLLWNARKVSSLSPLILHGTVR